VGEEVKGGGSTCGCAGGAAQNDEFQLVVLLEEEDLFWVAGALSLEAVVRGAKKVLGVIIRDLALVSLLLLEVVQTSCD
jgi:hypothetical protein